MSSTGGTDAKRAKAAQEAEKLLDRRVWELRNAGMKAEAIARHLNQMYKQNVTPSDVRQSVLRRLAQERAKANRTQQERDDFLAFSRFDINWNMTGVSCNACEGLNKKNIVFNPSDYTGQEYGDFSRVVEAIRAHNREFHP
jgi:hypothetical protein